MKIKTLGKKVSDRSFIKTVAWQLAVGILSFAFARTTIFENFSPLSTVMVSAVPMEFTPVAAIFGIIGYLTLGTVGFRYISCLVSICAIRWFFSSFITDPNKKLWFPVLSCFACVTVTGLAFGLLSDLSASDIVIFIGEGLLSGAVSYFFARTFAVKSGKGQAMSFEENVCIIISCALWLMALYPFTVSDISPARIIAVLAILISARTGKYSLGAVAGTALGLTLFMFSHQLLFAALGFAFGGLMAGICSKLGKIGICVAFTVGNGTIAMQALDNEQSLIILYEVLIASVLFMIMPKSFEKFITSEFSYHATLNESDGLKSDLVMRLKFASDALKDVCKTTQSVSERLSQMDNNSFENIFSDTEDEVCSRCSLRVYCWETNRGKTLSALLDGVKVLRRHNALSVEDLPYEFYSECAYPEKIIASLAENFARFVSTESADKRLSEVRTVVSEQFDGISQMLMQLAEEFELSEHYDPLLAKDIETALLGAGISPTDIACKSDKNGRISAEIKIDRPDGERISSSVLLRELSSVCRRDFDPPTVSNFEDYSILTVSESTCFSLDFGVCRHTKDGNRFCGDAYSFFHDGKGHGIMILSDGMGSGGRAAVDGTMACALMSRLIKAGFGFECALKLVNSAMIFKSNEESVATVDICSVDLYTGCTEIFKAGAPASIICRNGKSGIVESEALPPGILNDVSFEKSELKLSKGDKILMVSDGALESGVEWIEVELEVWKEGSAQDLAEHITDYAKRRCPPGHQDDITVMAAIIY